VSVANDEIAVVCYLLQHKTQLFDSESQLQSLTRQPSNVATRSSLIDTGSQVTLHLTVCLSVRPSVRPSVC